MDWRASLAVTLNDDIAITTSLMVLCPLSIALCGVELRSLNFGSESLSRRRLCKGLAAACGGSGRLVCFYLLPASHPYSCLAGPTTLASGL